jgi:hypothetical protein
VPAGFGLDAVDVDADGDNNGGITCVANESGVVFCFGAYVPDTLEGLPLRFDVLADATRLTVSTEGICATRSDNTTACALVSPTFDTFGCTSDGPCGALNGDRAFAVETGNACRVNGGEALCGGDNTFGVVNPASRAPQQTLPETLVLANVTAVSVGTQHACAITAGEIRCWGRPVFGATGVLEADVAVTEPCAADPAVRCHGVIAVPMPAGLSAFVELDTHRTQSCARTLTGQVACFGGTLNTDESSRPRSVALAP